MPPLGEVDFPVNIIWVSQVNKGQVLQDQTSEGTKAEGNLLYWGRSQKVAMCWLCHQDLITTMAHDKQLLNPRASQGTV